MLGKMAIFPVVAYNVLPCVMKLNMFNNVFMLTFLQNYFVSFGRISVPFQRILCCFILDEFNHCIFLGMYGKVLEVFF